MSTATQARLQPYYQDDRCTIYHGDCREILPQLSWDVLLTDPPYGVGFTNKTSDYRDSPYFNNGQHQSRIYSDEPDGVQKLIREAITPAIERSVRAAIFPGTAMLRHYPEPASIGAVLLPNGAGRCKWGFSVWQPILYYGKDPYLASGKGGRPNGFRTEQPNRDNFDHPCVKPIEWLKWLITRVSIDSTEVICDPFVGSGTTLRAAKDIGQPAIGIEIDEQYCEIAADRLRQGVLF